MRRFGCAAAASLLLAAGLPVHATPYTPLHWQRPVEQHANPVFVGQRKHTTWVRDRNRNFIDDDIEQRFKPGDKVDVIVALNDCATAALLEMLSRYGHVRYVGRLVTSVHVDGVPVADLRDLAQRPEVAMVEWQRPSIVEIDVASRASEARTSTVYQAIESSAEALGLTGAGVNIAIVGQGVDDGPGGTHAWAALPAGRFVAGVDVTDPGDPRDGSRNPGDAGWVQYSATTVLPGHETSMAMLALGGGVAGSSCRFGGAGADCRGIAPQAGLVDVRYCSRSGPNGSPTVSCSDADRTAALDWIGAHARSPGFSIHVAVLAFSVCGDDDGTSVLAQQVNHLAALGVVPVASYPSVGNENAYCRTPGSAQALPGDRLTKAPASASYAISVNGSNDKGSVNRNDDSVWAHHLDGPRSDFNLMTPNLLALKPDLTAAATNLSTAVSSGIGGTSPAAAIVGGLAALVLQRVPTMTPDDVKELLRASADASRNASPYDASTGVWQKDLGWGLANAGRALALSASRRTNVKFPTCQTPSTSGSGSPCSLSDGNPSWLNTQDLSTASPPQRGVANTVTAMVRNDGASPARVRVHFGHYTFGAGAAQFHDLGTVDVLVPAQTTLPVSMPWTPSASDHECVQVSIAYGEDVDFSDNLTQRNFAVMPSRFEMRVENAFAVPAQFEVVATSQRKGWDCLPARQSFTLDPAACARKVEVVFEAPAGTRPGEQARCDVAVWATPRGGERRLAGGVSLGTYVPRPCRVAGSVVDAAGKPIAGARLSFARMAAAGDRRSAVLATTATDGTFVATLTPDVVQTLIVRTPRGGGTVTLRPGCGGIGRIVVHATRVELQPLVPRLATPAPGLREVIGAAPAAAVCGGSADAPARQGG